MYYRLLALTLSVGVLAGCATQPASMSTSTTPIVPPAQVAIPSANWENLGVSPNGNILHEIDKMSISRQGNLVTFRDRVTIFNLNKETFLTTPRHKVSINTWQIDCTARTYKLNAMILFDENGRQISSDIYNGNQIKAAPVVQNSASYQQMLYVCKSTPSI